MASAGLRSGQLELSIGLIDDHPMVIDGLEQLLSSHGFAIRFACGDGESALRALVATPPKLIIVDLNVRGLSGTSLIAALRQINPGVILLVFSMADDAISVRQAFAAGVTGYLLKGASSDQILQAIESCLGETRFLDPSLHLDGHYHSEPLTAREEDVLRELLKGRTTRAIAEHLGIRPKTVENHRARISEKLGTHHLAQLIQYGLYQGLASQDD